MNMSPCARANVASRCQFSKLRAWLCEFLSSSVTPTHSRTSKRCRRCVTSLMNDSHRKNYVCRPKTNWKPRRVARFSRGVIKFHQEYPTLARQAFAHTRCRTLSAFSCLAIPIRLSCAAPRSSLATAVQPSAVVRLGPCRGFPFPQAFDSRIATSPSAFLKHSRSASYARSDTTVNCREARSLPNMALQLTKSVDRASRSLWPSQLNAGTLGIERYHVGRTSRWRPPISGLAVGAGVRQAIRARGAAGQMGFFCRAATAAGRRLFRCCARATVCWCGSPFSLSAR
jgi:hypothetical protein